jgi:hypothetical protein
MPSIDCGGLADLVQRPADLPDAAAAGAIAQEQVAGLVAAAAAAPGRLKDAASQQPLAKFLWPRIKDWRKEGAARAGAVQARAEEARAKAEALQGWASGLRGQLTDAARRRAAAAQAKAAELQARAGELQARADRYRQLAGGPPPGGAPQGSLADGARAAGGDLAGRAQAAGEEEMRRRMEAAGFGAAGPGAPGQADRGPPPGGPPPDGPSPGRDDPWDRPSDPDRPPPWAADAPEPWPPGHYGDWGDDMPVDEQGRHVEPPYDGGTAGALAGLANTDALMRDTLGFGLSNARRLTELDQAVDGFADCAAALPTIPDPQVEAMAAWGTLGRVVQAVRDGLGVDLRRPDAGARLDEALAGRGEWLKSRIAAFEAEGPAAEDAYADAARRVAAWGTLAQTATALEMPVAGPQALSRLGEKVRWIADRPVPPPGDTARLTRALGYLDNAQAVRDGLEVDPFARGAGGRLREIADRVRENLKGRVVPPVPPAGRLMLAGTTKPAVEQVERIDRTQAKDLALGRLSQAASPILSRATPVLSTLRAARSVGQRSLVRP